MNSIYSNTQNLCPSFWASELITTITLRSNWSYFINFGMIGAIADLFEKSENFTKNRFFCFKYLKKSQIFESWILQRSFPLYSRSFPSDWWYSHTLSTEFYFSTYFYVNFLNKTWADGPYSFGEVINFICVRPFFANIGDQFVAFCGHV